MLEIINEKVIEQAILDAIPKRTSLVYIDYRESFQHSVKEFQRVLDGEDWWEVIDSLVEDGEWLWDAQADSIDRIVKEEVKPTLCELIGDDDRTIEEVLSDYEDLIRDTCYERDDSTPTDDLLRNTSAEPVLAILYSNHQGLNSHWYMANEAYQYEDDMKSIIDILQLNPAEVKKELLDFGIKVAGRWPAKPKRDPYVTAYSFVRELQNTSSACNLLTFKGLLELGDLKNYKGKVTFHKGSECGLFDPFCGSGSILEMTLLRDFTVDTSKRYGQVEYDHFRVRLDKSVHYSMDKVYGPTRAFWGDTVTIEEK